VAGPTSLSGYSPRLKLCKAEPMDENLRRLVRELIERPESPTSLAIQAGLEKMLRPSEDAIGALIEALALQIEQPGPEADAAVAAAKVRYQAVTDQSADPFMDDFRRMAQELLQSRLRRPPKMEEVLGLNSPVRDLQYDLAGLLGGLRGTWHRLWASISSREMFADMGLEPDDTVALIRKDFEDQLGRGLSEKEWNTLEAHAVRNYREI